MYFRTIWESASKLSEARQALMQGEIKTGIELLGRSLSWSAPFNPYASQARALLSELQNDETVVPEIREEAAKTTREALMRSRSILAPHDELVTQGLGTVVRPETVPAPNYLVQVFAQIAFWGWVASVVLLILRGFDAGGAFIPAKAIPFIGTGVSGYILWLILLRFA